MKIDSCNASERIEIRVTSELKQALKEKAREAYMSLSQLLIQSALNSKIRITVSSKPEKTTEILKLTAAVNKLGSQLNMIAKHCNYHKGASETAFILQGLSTIESEMLKLSRTLFGEPVDATRLQ
ncbi:plasmid mobilization protein [Pseudomonas sp. EL_65y_Pfl2_R96]|uniref:plasmid mobilization protein n=1 Tax=Pseudomonas sp. EL_65y_Pfl2_R96 TaxID=3088699 RepID=UPI0030D9223F